MEEKKISKAYSLCDEIKEHISKGFEKRIESFGLDLTQIRQTAEQNQSGTDTLQLLAFIQSIRSWLIGS